MRTESRAGADTALVILQDWHSKMQQPQVWRRLNLRNAAEPGPALWKLQKLPAQLCDQLKEVNLEFATDVRDNMLQGFSRLQLTALNLNACQK